VAVCEVPVPDEAVDLVGVPEVAEAERVSDDTAELLVWAEIAMNTVTNSVAAVTSLRIARTRRRREAIRAAASDLLSGGWVRRSERGDPGNGKTEE
jgi:hypothetical protein